jgi:hypothetical protein
MLQPNSPNPRTNNSSGTAARVALAAAVLSIFITGNGHAQRTVNWIGGTDIWDDNGNWLDDQAPPQNLQPFASDDAVIASGTPLCDSFENIFDLSVAAGAGINDQGSLISTGGTVSNDGTILVDNGVTPGTAEFSAGVGVLQGNGEVVLGDSDFAMGGATLSTNGIPTGFVTHGDGHTIRGEGTVTGRWINDGLIRAEDVSGDATGILRISGTMTNNGVIRSSSTAVVDMRAALTLGATGEFVADSQNIVFSNGGSLTGGEIDAINGAKFVFGGGGFTTLSDVTVNGDFEAILPNPGGTVTIGGGGIVNNGTMTLDNTGTSELRLAMNSGTTLGGTGEIVLAREGADRATIRGGQYTNGPTHTIRGVGAFRATTVASSMINNGEILAEPVNGGTVLRVSGTNITNNNLMQAGSGAILRFQGDTFATGLVNQSAAGVIRAANGGTVEILAGFPVAGGTLQTQGTGVIKSSGATLTNVTNEGSLEIANDTTTRIGGAGLTNNGTITVNPGVTTGFPPTVLTFENNSTLQGTGTVLLNSTDAEINTVGGDKVVTQDAGHTIRGKGLIRFGTIENHGRIEGLSPTEQLKIGGAVSGDGVLKDVWFNAGFHIAGGPGSTAIVPLEGSYRIDGTGFISVGRLFMDLAGTTPGNGYDQLNSTGPITIGSQTHLSVSLAGGFFPDGGDSFTLLTTTDMLTGNFVVTNLPTLPPGLSWMQSQTSTAYSISVAGDIAADFDDDGDVDGDDLTIWQAGYGTGTLHGEGNADGDGDVDGRDFLIWQRSYGWGVTSLAASIAVPEPACLALFCMATLGLFVQK